MDERRRLDRVARPLPPDVARGQPAEFAVDERDELLQRGRVTASRLFDETGDGAGGRAGHSAAL